MAFNIHLLYFYHKLHLIIEYSLNLETYTLFDGEIELNKSYFGSIHKGKRGQGVSGKTAVFRFLKRNDKITVIVKDAKTDTLIPIIGNKNLTAFVYTDYYKNYNALDVSDFKHFRVNRSKEFTHNLQDTRNLLTAS